MTSKFFIKWSTKVIFKSALPFFVASLIALIVFICLYPQIVHKILGTGLLPRCVSWFFLLYASYGLARARIPFSIAFFLYGLSFFIAYIGPYVPFIKQYY